MIFAAGVHSKSTSTIILSVSEELKWFKIDSDVGSGEQPLSKTDNYVGI